MIVNIAIPKNSKCLLKKGQEVDFNTPFLDTEENVNIQIPIANSLNISPSKIFNFLKKFVGENIKKGDIIAVKKGFFSSYKVICEHDGVIQEINHNEGIIIIQSEDGPKNKIPAYFKGEIQDIKNNIIHLKVKSANEFDITKSNNNFGGKTTYSKSDNILLSSEIQNKILIAENLTDYDISKAEALGIKGIASTDNLCENSEVLCAQIQKKDIEKIFDLKLPYCFIDKERSKIVFYA